MKNKYRKRIKRNKDQIVNDLLNSTEFKVESEYGFGESLYTNSRLTTTYIVQIDKYSFQFGENAGQGGMTETVGSLEIEDDISGSIITLSFRMGIFPIVLPQYLCILAIIVALFFLKQDIIITYISLGVAFISLILWIVKYFSIRLILKRVSKTLKTEDIWDEKQ